MEPACESRPTCPVCGQEAASSVVYCRACDMPQHRDCWNFLGTCSRYGCGSAEFTEDSPAHSASMKLPILILQDDPTPALAVRDESILASPLPVIESSLVELGLVYTTPELQRLGEILRGHRVPYRVVPGVRPGLSPPPYTDGTRVPGVDNAYPRIFVPQDSYLLARTLAHHSRVNMLFTPRAQSLSWMNYPIILTTAVVLCVCFPTGIPFFAVAAVLAISGRELLELAGSAVRMIGRGGNLPTSGPGDHV